MEIEIVKYFQGWANKFTDSFFWLITKMGEEVFFLMILAVVYLCYSDKYAIKLTFYYLISVAINTVVKLICRRPRPYVASNEVVDRLHANGYSFPSGHSQGYFVSATTNMIEINKNSSRKSLKISAFVTFIVLGILVMVSRMFWGQHYLTDVVVGMMFGIAIPFILSALIRIIPKKIKDFCTIDRLYMFVGIVALILAIVLIIINIIKGTSVDKAYKFSAVFIAMAVGYWINKKKIKYNANQGFKIGLLKAMITIFVIVGLYALINLIFPIKSYMYFVVYLFLGLICTIILPILFKLIFKKGYINEESNN